MSDLTEQLWDAFRHRLRAFVRSRIADSAMADDVLQQAFMKMHVHLSHRAAPDDPKAWVYAVTRNAIIDHYRSRSAQATGSEPVTELAAPPPEPEDARRALEACVVPLLQALPPAYREALGWTLQGGLTQAEAARRAGISLSGMKSRVQRGRRLLRAQFEDCCQIELDGRNRPRSVTRPPGDCPCDDQV